MPTVSRTKGKNKSKSKAASSAPAAERNAARDYSIAAVGRALDLLEALARIGPAPLATLAESARCTRTAGFRLLRTLEARGFAIQDEARGIWRLGARWAVLGRAAQQQGALAAAAMPFLATLGKATGENVYLRIRDGMESAGPSRLLLAHAPEAVQTQVLAQRLPRFTPATRTDSAWIAADLQRIRARGYLVTADEVVPGAVGVTAPVRDASGQVVAGLTVSAPSMRMRPPRPRALVPQVLDAALKLSQLLGDVTAAPGQATNGQKEQTSPMARWTETHGAASAGPHSIFR